MERDRLPWADVKRDALSERRNRVAGQPLTIVTSFTDAQPLHGWENVHAIRELWQNFRDGLHTRFGAGVTMHCTAARVFEARQGARVVGRLDCSRPDLFQLERILAIDCLNLASTKREEGDIGGHGEGLAEQAVDAELEALAALGLSLCCRCTAVATTTCA